MLTFTEKRVLQDFLNRTESADPGKANETIYSCFLAIGGALLIAACLFLANNLSAENLKLVFYPGIATGMVILFVGAFGTHYSTRTREQKQLASAIKKLMN